MKPNRFLLVGPLSPEVRRPHVRMALKAEGRNVFHLPDGFLPRVGRGRHAGGEISYCAGSNSQMKEMAGGTYLDGLA